MTPETVMVYDKSVWIAYLLGAFLRLAVKWASTVYHEALANNKKIGASTLEWFFDPSVSNVSSWIATIGVVWAFGYIWIQQVPWGWFAWTREIPVHESIAFLMGALMETIAPAAIKFIASKIPFASILGMTE